jgi:hypothetical protein
MLSSHKKMYHCLFDGTVTTYLLATIFFTLFSAGPLKPRGPRPWP